MGRFIPPGFAPAEGRVRSVRLRVLACALLLAVPAGVFAQAPDAVRTFFVPALTFNIPFSTDNDPRIVEVLLYVSQDGKNYRYVDKVGPQARKFLFSTRQEGPYWFVVQTRDSGGVLRPANPQDAVPSIRVNVDTHIPVIEDLSAVVDRQGGLPVIHWKIKEDYLQTIRAEYRSVNGDQWLPLDVPAQLQGNQPWKPAWGGELEVRMWAQDKAGQWSEMRTARLRVADNVSGMRPPPEPAGAGKVMHVKSKTFQLQYKLDQETVGPSQVASVDIWKLYPGRGWQKCKESGRPEGPATVTVEASGRWGFRLIPRSGVGLAERDPQQGDAPDIWVEVDDKAPQVKVTNVTVTQEADGGYLTVYWKADDTFLRAMPITIQKKDPEGGTWETIAAELPNTGSWRHRTDDLLRDNRYQFLLKVVAIDEAGNVGSDQWREVVKVDLKIPRIKSIEVNPAGAPAGGGGGQEAYRAPQTNPMGGPPGGVPPAGGLLQPPMSGFPGGQQASRPAPSATNATGGGFSVPDRSLPEDLSKPKPR